MRINADEVVIVYMSQVTCAERFYAHKPRLPFTVPDNEDKKGAIEQAMELKPYQYDLYKDIVQLSFLFRDSFVHCMVVPKELPQDARTDTVQDREDRIIARCTDERALINTGTAFITDVYPALDNGILVNSAAFAGWELRTRIWPLLANKAFAYGINLPDDLRADPGENFMRSDRLIDMSRIYLQGANPSVRRLPAISDALYYWGYRSGNAKMRRHPPEEGLIEELEISSETAADGVEIYLTDMRDVIQRYYNN